jgi:uncharacterized protein DUF1236
MRRIIRRFALGSAASLWCTALLWVAAGQAQTPQAQPPNPEVPATTRTVNLTLEQRHVIRELVRDLTVDRASDDDSKVAAGDEVPGKVTLHPIPPLIGQKVPQIKAHRFYVTQSRVVIVDPQDQKVVEVIE